MPLLRRPGLLWSACVAPFMKTSLLYCNYHPVSYNINLKDPYTIRKIIYDFDDPVIYNLFVSTGGFAPRAGSREAVFSRIIYEPEYVPDQILLKKHRIDMNQRRQTVIFRSFTSLSGDIQLEIVTAENDR